MSQNAVELKNVRYVYPDGLIALDDVNLEIKKREKVAIIGPNGAGKSTLLMNMVGIIKPSQGEINILGTALNDKNIYEIRRKVGLTFQNPDDQLFCSTVFEDVAFGPTNQGLTEEEVTLRTKEALKQVGLEGYENRQPHHLSEGEKKKVAIATVLSMHPRVLIIDEPTANLDPKSREELIELINNLSREQEFTLIVATHDVEAVSQISDRIFILNKGRVVAEGPVREVFSQLNLLREARLQPPTIFQLFNRLVEKGFAGPKNMPLTIDEALDEIQRLRLKK
jgi:cobalt/nickel transport system ATP-binding protein